MRFGGDEDDEDLPWMTFTRMPFVVEEEEEEEPEPFILRIAGDRTSARAGGRIAAEHRQTTCCVKSRPQAFRKFSHGYPGQRKSMTFLIVSPVGEMSIKNDTYFSFNGNQMPGACRFKLGVEGIANNGGDRNQCFQTANRERGNRGTSKGEV